SDCGPLFGAERVQLHLVDDEGEERVERALLVHAVGSSETLNLLDAHNPVAVAVEHSEDGSRRVCRTDVHAHLWRRVTVRVKKVADGLCASFAYAREHLPPRLVSAGSGEARDVAVLIHHETLRPRDAGEDRLGLKLKVWPARVCDGAGRTCVGED